MPLTAADIAWHMRQHFAELRHDWITPNAMLYAWESDLLTVSPFGEVFEIEIKVSRSDLKNDLLKPKHSQGMLVKGAFQVKDAALGRTFAEAHEEARQLAGAEQCRRPNYFCFAMPCEAYRTEPRIALPRYAGVFTVDEQGRVVAERPPEMLHKDLITQEDLLGLARRMHHRYWDELRRARHTR